MVRLYGLVWFFVALVVKIIIRFGGGKSWGLSERIAPAYPFVKGDVKETLWFHCASMGEAKGLLGLLGELGKSEMLFGHEASTQTVLLTASTLAGKRILEDNASQFYKGRLLVQMAPLDYAPWVQKFVKHYRISLLCLYEVELWPNYITESKKAGAEVVWVGARVTAKAAFVYGLLGRLGRSFCKVLEKVDRIQAQSAEDKKRIEEFYSKEISIGVDYKFPYYKNIFHSKKENLPCQWFTLVSVYLPEVKKWLPALEELQKTYSLAIIPRKLDDIDSYFNLLAPLGFKRESEGNKTADGLNYVLVDSYGKVGHYLSQSKACFMGGSLIPKGCHNLWEPLMAGVYTFVGPFVENQQGAYQVMMSGAMAHPLKQPWEAVEMMLGEALPTTGKEAEALIEGYGVRVKKAVEWLG